MDAAASDAVTGFDACLNVVVRGSLPSSFADLNSASSTGIGRGIRAQRTRTHPSSFLRPNSGSNGRGRTNVTVAIALNCKHTRTQSFRLFFTSSHRDRRIRIQQTCSKKSVSVYLYEENRETKEHQQLRQGIRRLQARRGLGVPRLIFLGQQMCRVESADLRSRLSLGPRAGTRR